jgi:DNA-binding SARP family transcriptional activator
MGGGDPLPDIAQGDVLAARCLALREEHAAVVEAHAQAHLALGLGPGIVPALRAHLQAHPFRERGWELLIWALYDAGDVGGALAAFTQARSTMVGHLGIEPGRRLIELQQAVLDGDPVGVDAPGPRRHPVAGLSGAYRRPS